MPFRKRRKRNKNNYKLLKIIAESKGGYRHVMRHHNVTSSCNYNVEVTKCKKLLRYVTSVCNNVLFHENCNMLGQPSYISSVCNILLICDCKIPILAGMVWCYGVTQWSYAVTVTVYPSTHVCDDITLWCYITCLYQP